MALSDDVRLAEARRLLDRARRFELALTVATAIVVLFIAVTTLAEVRLANQTARDSKITADLVRNCFLTPNANCPIREPTTTTTKGHP